MVKNKVIILAVLLVVAGFLTDAFALRAPYSRTACLMGQCWKHINVQKMGEVGCPAPAMIIDNVLREMNGYLAASKFLNLTPDQVRQLKSIRYKSRSKLFKGKAQMSLLSINLIDQMATDDFQLDKVLDLAKQLKATCHGLLFQVIQDAIAARQVLTPEQRKKAKEYAM